MRQLARELAFLVMVSMAVAIFFTFINSTPDPYIETLKPIFAP